MMLNCLSGRIDTEAEMLRWEGVGQWIRLIRPQCHHQVDALAQSWFTVNIAGEIAYKYVGDFLRFKNLDHIPQQRSLVHGAFSGRFRVSF